MSIPHPGCSRGNPGPPGQRQRAFFAHASDDRAAWGRGVEKLGAIPLDPLVSQSGDRAHPLLLAYPQSAQAAAFRQIAGQLAAKLEARPE